MSAFSPEILRGKVAFVTGGTSGINWGIARRLVQAGARVTILGRNEAKADEAARQLQEIGGSDCALAVTADVRDAAAMEAAFSRSVEVYGEIDVLVAGAAGNFPAPALGLSSNGFKAVVDIDLVGTFHACRFGFEYLRKPGASIIAISAPQAGQATPMQAHVCAAKAGVDQLTRVLAFEWGGAGVRVNSIWPGAVDGTEGMARLAATEEARVRLERGIPLGRLASIEDIAEMALFLACDSSSYVTGAVFVCDGGLSLVGMGAMALGM
ncbi:MAG: SDR family oxidoreductase [Myxococcota bacterium]